MSTSSIRRELQAIGDETTDLVSRAHAGEVTLEEIEEFERRVWPRVALAGSAVRTLEDLEFMRSVETDLVQLPVTHGADDLP